VESLWKDVDQSGKRASEQGTIAFLTGDEVDRLIRSMDRLVAHLDPSSTSATDHELRFGTGFRALTRLTASLTGGHRRLSAPPA
jgi:hypothetical protein